MKQSKNEIKKMKSISRRINGRWTAGLFAVFLFFDLLICAVALSGWCYFKETAQGEPFDFSTSRSLGKVSGENDLPEEQWKQYQNYLTAPAGKLDAIKDSRLGKLLKNVRYYYVDRAGKTVVFYAGSYLIFLVNSIRLIVYIQLFILVVNFITGSREIRKYLRPLDDMARNAQFLANAAILDEEKFHHLEHAISEISPTRSDARLQTGDSDLQGLEDAINNLLLRMRQSYQQQARFVSDASHELRTPIAVIQGYANMLDRWGKEDQQILEESIDAIKSESSHMKQLVEQLLFLARGDSGRTKLDFQELSVTDMIREIVDESSMIDQKHQYHLKQASEELRILGDTAMLKQAVRILVDNASKYTPEEGEITLSAVCNEKNEVCIIVQDEGIGIPSQDVSHIFERFFRSDPARSRENGGSGLGLSIAKWIIDKHGGYFRILSREEIGTRITICLPQKQNQI